MKKHWYKKPPPSEARLSPGTLSLSVATLLLLLFVGGCGSSTDRRLIGAGALRGGGEGELIGAIGAQLVFRGEWFDHYLRALQRLEAGQPDQAEADLRHAIDVRPDDTRMARTYGMHRIEYYPQRELGILLYQRGAYEEALASLQHSLDTQPTSRTKFYLNQTRRALLKDAGVEAAPPLLTLDAPLDGLRTAQAAVRVVGSARDENYVSTVRIDGAPVFLELARQEMTFSQDVPLLNGENEIEVVVENLVGRREVRRVRVYRDSQAPTLYVMGCRWDGEGLHLRAVLHDEGGLRHAVLGDTRLELDGRETVQLDQRLAVTDESLPFSIEDSAGNVLRGALSPTADSTLFGRADGEPVRVADADPLTDVAVGLEQMEDLAASGLPHIQLHDMEQPSLTVMLDRFYLEGRVHGAAPITSLRLHDRELLRASAKEIHFGEILDLADGENNFLLAAVDAAAARAETSVALTRISPQAYTVEQRLAISIAPFVCQAELAGDLEGKIEPLIAQAFTQAGRFHVLDRDHLAALMLEHRIAATDLAHPNRVTALGRLLHADLLMTGEVRRSPGGRGVEIVAYLTEIATGKEIHLHDVYGEDVDLPMLRYMLQGLYLKFARHYPLLAGRVTQVRGDRLLAELDDPLWPTPGMPFLVYRRGEPLTHPLSGRLLGRPATILADGVALPDEDATGRLALRLNGRDNGIRPGDRVVAK